MEPNVGAGSVRDLQPPEPRWRYIAVSGAVLLAGSYLCVFKREPGESDVHQPPCQTLTDKEDRKRFDQVARGRSVQHVLAPPHPRRVGRWIQHCAFTKLTSYVRL